MSTLQVRGLQVRRGDREIIRSVDVDVAPGEVCVLMGESGAGKTTILRLRKKSSESGRRKMT